ncbi:MAG: hypothetical protein H0X07_09160 [Gemmatimonadales bacterium]|nr:hypothetical protein [Gemmatimonadales bacterium]
MPSLVGAIVLALGGAAWYFLARRSRRLPASAAVLLDAIATLDARYLGLEEETSAEAWLSYRTERGRLKAELETALASGAPSQ